MDDDCIPQAGPPLDPRLHGALDRLRPALRGYPVEALLAAAAVTQARERQQALQLMDHCLSRWIAQLDRPQPRTCEGLPDILETLDRRQRGTRDALAALHCALCQVRVDHNAGGQGCG